MYKRLVEADKGMGACRMPDLSLGWIALVGNPYMGLEVLKLVILDYLFCISHDL